MSRGILPAVLFSLVLPGWVWSGRLALSKENGMLFSNAASRYCLAVHDVGRLVVGITNYGKIGIGRGRGPDPVAHVLGRFEPDEEPVAEQAIDAAADAVETWLSEGIGATMNAFN